MLCPRCGGNTISPEPTGKDEVYCYSVGCGWAGADTRADTRKTEIASLKAQLAQEIDNGKVLANLGLAREEFERKQVEISQLRAELAKAKRAVEWCQEHTARRDEAISGEMHHREQANKLRDQLTAMTKRAENAERERDEWKRESLDARMDNAALRTVLHRVADHTKCERWDVSSFAGEYKFKGCDLHRSDDPQEYCLGCQAEELLAAPNPGAAFLRELEVLRAVWFVADQFEGCAERKEEWSGPAQALFNAVQTARGKLVAPRSGDG